MQYSAGFNYSLPAGFEIRAPRTDEIEQLIDIHLALPAHQQRSPVFSGIRPWTRPESRKEWLETLAQDEEKLLVGSLDGRAVACWAIVPVECSGEHLGLLLPDGACYLSFAATLPEFRGSGIGVAVGVYSVKKLRMEIRKQQNDKRSRELFCCQRD